MTYYEESLNRVRNNKQAQNSDLQVLGLGGLKHGISGEVGMEVYLLQ